MQLKCRRVFTEVLLTYIALKVYENKALWNTGKPSKTEATHAANENGRIDTKHTTS